MADWAGLVLDILFMIATRIDQVEDFLSFSFVCSTWRASTLCQGATRSLQPLRWLMFRSRYEAKNTHEIYNFSKDKIYRISLPMEEEHSWKKKTNGWILMKNLDHNAYLFHPFSRQIISLPPETTFSNGKQCECCSFLNVKKAVLSLSPILSPNDYILIILHQYEARLGVWKPGDKAWTIIETADIIFDDMIYINGQFYAVDRQGMIYVCHINGCNLTALVSISNFKAGSPYFGFYLVEITDSHSSLLVVTYEYDNHDESIVKSKEGASRFRVYKVDLSGKGVEEVIDLGNRTIFLDDDHSICIENSKFPPGIIEAADKNVYFHDLNCCPHCSKNSNGCPVEERSHKRGMCIGVQNLKDDKVEDFFYPLESLSVFPPV